MAADVRTSPKAAAALLFGLLSLGCGLLVLLGAPDFLLLGVPLFFGLAIPTGVLGGREVKRSHGQLRGKALAGWGIGLPVGGVCLGFLLLPAV